MDGSVVDGPGCSRPIIAVVRRVAVAAITIVVLGAIAPRGEYNSSVAAESQARSASHVFEFELCSADGKPVGRTHVYNRDSPTQEQSSAKSDSHCFDEPVVCPAGLSGSICNKEPVFISAGSPDR